MREEAVLVTGGAGFLGWSHLDRKPTASLEDGP